VTDANTGQTPVIAAVVKWPANPGAVNFAFTLNAGSLAIAPVAMLTVAEAGFHLYEVQVTDGTNVVSIHVSITVASPPLLFLTPATLPEGETSQAYDITLSTSGAIGVQTFALTTGTLPAGLAMDAAGQISGTPTQAETATFTVEATDSTGATASRSFTLTIIAPVVSPPHPGPDTGNNGCAAGSAISVLPVVLAALGALRRRRRAS
jgi:uncharacterized protein (TIGR03382 family)